MSYELTAEEQESYDKINVLMEKAKEQLENFHMDADFHKMVIDMGKEAHKLHLSLKEHNHEPKHHAYMIENRGMNPEDEEFYMHIHPVEDLIAFVKDPHANDDPEDKTLNVDFELKIFSRRWGHEDVYHIKRTQDGWYCKFDLFTGLCDKRGHPHIFNGLNNDLVQYPCDVDSWLEWLWNQAASRGLSENEVQLALNEIGEWISKTERNAPSGGVWEGHS